MKAISQCRAQAKGGYYPVQKEYYLCRIAFKLKNGRLSAPVTTTGPSARFDIHVGAGEEVRVRRKKWRKISARKAHADCSVEGDYAWF